MKSKVRYIKNLLDEDIGELRKESKRERYNHIERLINDFKSGVNKFSNSGEALVVYERDNKIVGICGLNVDPADSKKGRIRRLYVLPQCRKQGIGKKLVKELIDYSAKNFKSVSVNTGRLDISGFYKKLGFKKYDKEKGITHLLINK